MIGNSIMKELKRQNILDAIKIHYLYYIVYYYIIYDRLIHFLMFPFNHGGGVKKEPRQIGLSTNGFIDKYLF